MCKILFYFIKITVSNNITNVSILPDIRKSGSIVRPVNDSSKTTGT
jgi:hypothetical protein